MVRVAVFLHFAGPGRVRCRNCSCPGGVDWSAFSVAYSFSRSLTLWYMRTRQDDQPHDTLYSVDAASIGVRSARSFSARCQHHLILLSESGRFRFLVLRCGLERPVSPRRIYAVTRSFQRTTRDLSVFPFLPRRYHMTRVLLVLTRLDYCNSLLHGSHTSSIQTLQRVQNNAARIVLQASRQCHANPLLRQLHWLPVRHRINYKLVVMTYMIHSTGLPAYLSHNINTRESTRTLRSSETPLLTVPFTRTELAKRTFRCSAPSVWNSLPSFITSSKSRLKTYFRL